MHAVSRIAKNGVALTLAPGTQRGAPAFAGAAGCWTFAFPLDRSPNPSIFPPLFQMSKNLHVAIVGATGAVGIEMMKTLEKRNFPVGKLTLLASAKSAG